MMSLNFCTIFHLRLRWRNCPACRRGLRGGGAETSRTWSTAASSLPGYAEKAIADLVAAGIQLHESVIGDDGAAVFVVRAETAFGGFSNTPMTVYVEPSTRISLPMASSMLGKKGLGDVFADDHDVVAMLVFGFGEEAARPSWVALE